MITNFKRSFPFTTKVQTTLPSKKTKFQLTNNEYKNTDESKSEIFYSKIDATVKQFEPIKMNSSTKRRYLPLAEKMRPSKLDDFIGQTHLIGPKNILHDLLKNGEIPSMILWGPPGCGKTSLVNIIRQESKKLTNQSYKFIELSATNASINDVKKAVTEAKLQSKRGRTIVFMDEIHRFNKLQQDIFLPHVEVGTFILIGATTENPSSGLNSALLSRCRIFVLKKLNPDELFSILSKAVASMEGKMLKNNESNNEISVAKFCIDKEVIDWLADVCDGDARVALGALEISVQSEILENNLSIKPIKLNLNNIKNSLKKAQFLNNTKSNIRHMYSALHHCILGNDDNAALYWLARIMETKEDPVYIAKQLVRIAGESIEFNDEIVLSTVTHTMHACQMIGMPECDVILAQCVMYLVRAKKSTEVLTAFKKCQNIIKNHKGSQPKVPLFIKDRSGEGKLSATFGPNYKNLICEENFNKSYLPAGLENMNFFH